MVFEGKNQTNLFQFELRHLRVQEIYVCILRKWQPLSTRTCQYILPWKASVTRLLIQLINYQNNSCILYSSFPCIIIFFYPVYSFKMSMGNKREGKKRSRQSEHPFGIKSFNTLCKNCWNKFLPFPMDRCSHFSSRRKLELDDKLQGLNVTP